RIPLPVTVSFGAPLPATTSVAEIRQAIAELDQRAWEHRKEDRRPLHHQFIREARRHPTRLALADPLSGELSCIEALAGTIALARALRPMWQGQDAVGVMLPTSVGGLLVNLAAALAGRVVINLNFTAGQAAMTSAAAQAGLRTLVTSRNFVAKASLELPDGVEVIWIEEIRSKISRMDRAAAL